MTGRILLTGASGFIGSTALRTLLDLPEPPRVRALTRGARPLPAGVEPVPADLARPESLTGVCAGTDVLVHLASHIGSDEEECHRVNVLGTAALMAEARASGVRRVVHLSTTAVYGPGPHSGPDVDEVPRRPVSPASRTRLEGEAHALRAGALVLRAGLVTGAGDRWVVPALARLLRDVPGYWDAGRGLISLIAVEDLGRLVAAAALGASATGVQHAVHPEPVRTRDLLDTLADGKVLPAPPRDLTWEESLVRLKESGSPVSERQFSLLARDHWYRGDAVWQRCGTAPGPGPLARLAHAAEWYRSHLTPQG
ncbi:NAD-dependent epimerase/dehydratase family protein [Streptomyces daliensis]|uniref:NAD(P)-dependent oxidoreductase n=1 Tax=Streptomyces daliensis TaxID=299421 RepID=A0A8T4J291_9ACTN|nr:NAD(P)-dependent oxidoreductase [Streptomyces daliensis]